MSNSTESGDSVIQYKCKLQIKEAKKIIASVLAGKKDKDLVCQAKMHAASLLQRSVNLKHDRLAIERFRVAVQINASINGESLIYCRKLLLSLENNFKERGLKV